MKKCTKCKKEKLESDFSYQNKSENKFMSICKDCISEYQKNKRLNNIEKQKKLDKIIYQKTKERRIKYAKEYRIKYPDRTRNTNLKSKYGIDQSEYNKKLIEQDNKCAICEISIVDYGKIFCVDHDHNTNKVRGLVCDTCNRGLGYYEKYKDIYIRYLNKY